MLFLVLSAILYATTFELIAFGDLGADIAAAAYLFSFILLYRAFQKNLGASLGTLWLLGVCWSAIAFSFHFRWVYYLLSLHCQVSTFEALFATLFIILGFLLSASLWFVGIGVLQSMSSALCGRLCRWIAFVSSIAGYLWFTSTWGLWFLGIPTGYPMLSPATLFARSRWGSFLLCVFSMILSGQMPTGELGWQRVHLASGESLQLHDVTVTYHSASGRTLNNPMQAAQYIYQAIGRVARDKQSHLILFPEAAFPFPLTQHPEALELWGQALGSSHLLLGAHGTKNEGSVTKYYQSAFHVHTGRIQNRYDKKHLVPFAEQLPTYWYGFSFARNLFLCSRVPLFAGALYQGTWQIAQQRFIPTICSDVPYGMTTSSERLERGVILWFVKDSWYTKSFVALLGAYAYRLALERGLPVLAAFSSDGLLVKPQCFSSFV